ncbi:hypothetical protein ColTof4_14018 [Colletotrichum tofieldiae]|nr:hypothetical protein ColTof4_14018 [Colletotrichum tofieldiae]
MLANGRFSKSTWRPSDQIIVKSSLAYHRLSVQAARELSNAPLTRVQRRRFFSVVQQDEDFDKAYDARAPDLCNLAPNLNIDLPSLSDDEWTAIKRKIVSSMCHTLQKHINNETLVTYFDDDTGRVSLQWPASIRDAWTHEHWWGDEEARMKPLEVGSYVCEEQRQTYLLEGTRSPDSREGQDATSRRPASQPKADVLCSMETLDEAVRCFNESIINVWECALAEGDELQRARLLPNSTAAGFRDALETSLVRRNGLLSG